MTPEYLDFVKAEVTRLFRPGWDRRYHSYVGDHLPNASSRKPLLSRADVLWAGRRGEFFNLCVRESDLGGLTSRFKEVTSAGKKRPLLIYDEKVDLLGPLHRMVYDHLAKTDWLLVGPPTPERITSTCIHPNQVSVDLVNATDGLYHSVAVTILDAMFFTSVKVPRSIRSFAAHSLSPTFESNKVERRVVHGQMMGAYLSFPLLCLQSYLAARWAARKDPGARFLVNGDDTVVSTVLPDIKADYPQGTRINYDKTMVAGNVVEVNSTTFLKTGKKWREIRHLRRGGACSDFPGLVHMSTACAKTGPAWVDAFWRSRIGRRWGFLPSQLGHSTYVSYLRERQLRRQRCFTRLPEPDSLNDEEGLTRVYGRQPLPEENEALKSLTWVTGRKGGMKRDVYSPSVGSVRRTYEYRGESTKYYGSFDSWWRTVVVSREGWRKCVFSSSPGLAFSRLVKKCPEWFLLPEEFQTAEEREAYEELASWASALVATAA
jgi:hypothetical protein